MSTSASVVLAALCAASTACSGWVRIPNDRPSRPPEFEQFQIWSHGTFTPLHSLRIEGDSLSGIPTTRPRGCAECRIAIPVNQVDSVRAGGTGKESSFGFGVLSGGIMGFTLIMFLVYSTAGHGT